MENKRPIPTIAQSLAFRGKAEVFRLKRRAENLLDFNLRKYPSDNSLIEKIVIAESKTELWTESAPEEKFLLAGKIHNLRLAVKKLNNLEIPAGAVFSFWKHLGKPSRFNNYVVGRELRQGCLIPNIGGGLCQISNALYDAALQANFEIVERHAHSQIVPGSLAELGRDATVFWNYVDLRFKSPHAFRIEAALDSQYLTIKFRSEILKPQTLHQISRHSFNNSKAPNSCATCGIDECHRVVKPPENPDFGRTAFLVDEYSPEFDEYLQSQRKTDDLLLVPLDGRRFNKANYQWNGDGFANVQQSIFVTAQRSFQSRRLQAQGATRQKNLLSMSEKLARSYAKRLTHDVLHVVVQQNILPFLWRTGILGGRTFDVLMTALPVENLQKRLDWATSLHPESPTLNDFRADQSHLEAENEALKNARQIITAHTEIAALFPNRARLLDWKLPPVKIFNKTANALPVIILPASNVGRKGVYELREAMRGLEVKLFFCGANLENENFWDGFEVERAQDFQSLLEIADLVVLPAFVEHQPRRVLQAAAQQIPVIASKACGLENVGGVVSIEAGNVAELRGGLQKMLASR